MWDIGVMFLATLNSFIVPIDIAFEPGYTLNDSYRAMTNGIDVVFLLDMVAISLTTFRDSNGSEVRNHFSIISRYVLSL